MVWVDVCVQVMHCWFVTCGVLFIIGKRRSVLCTVVMMYAIWALTSHISTFLRKMLKLCYIVRNTHVIPLYLVPGDLPNISRHAPAAVDDIFGIYFQLLQANAPWIAFLSAFCKETLQRIHETIMDTGIWLEQITFQLILSLRSPYE